MSQAEQPAALNAQLQCSSCGSTLYFAPGTHHLLCNYCGNTNEITPSQEGAIVSFDYDTFINTCDDESQVQVARVVSCKNCGAATTLPPEVNSENCSFCTSPLVLTEAEGRSFVKPHYVLPFLVPQQKALDSFRSWLRHLWFAPADLPKIVSGDARQFKGVYIPHWSYDTDSRSDYEGRRGDYYYTTEYYTERDANGKEVTRSRQVRHTAWTHVDGTVDYSFNDVLVSASHSLPQQVANRLEPWHMQALVHYNEQYVSGFRSELYQMDAAAGFEAAKDRMEPVIEKAILSDIGGDEQVINEVDTTYYHIALKYLILPVWISAYKYRNKLYHFTVNACTGEVVGEHPYSVVKIALAVITGLAILGGIIYYVSQHNNSY